MAAADERPDQRHLRIDAHHRESDRLALDIEHRPPRGLRTPYQQLALPRISEVRVDQLDERLALRGARKLSAAQTLVLRPVQVGADGLLVTPAQVLLPSAGDDEHALRDPMRRDPVP